MSDQSTMRPDYKPGDAEFVFDADRVIQYHGRANSIRYPSSDISWVFQMTDSLYRQATYWRHEAETTTQDAGIRQAYAELKAQHDAALETIASMARTIERLTNDGQNHQRNITEDVTE